MEEDNQKRYHNISLCGAAFLGLVPLIPAVSFLLLLIHSIIKDPQSVGYIVLFLTVPVLIFVGISSAVVILSFFALKQSFAKSGTQILIWHMIVGCVQLALVPIYFYVINYFLGMTLSVITPFDGFVRILQTDTFHPAKLIYGLYLVGPVLILLGGIVSNVGYRKQKNEEKNTI